MSPQLPQPDKAFQRAKEFFEQSTNYARNAAQQFVPHGLVEQQLRINAQQLMNCLFQAYIDQAALLQAQLATQDAPAGSTFRWRGRTLASWFGPIRICRLGEYFAGSHEAWFGLDQTIELPQKRYSQGTQRAVVKYCTVMSFESSNDFIERESCGAVSIGTRQMTEIMQHVALDIDDFLKERNDSVLHVANDTELEAKLLIGSCDATGIEVIERDLREETRKARAEATCEPKRRGDPMTSKKPERKHSMRMAMVTAVWDQPRTIRSVEQVIEALRRESTDGSERQNKLAAPENKVLDASMVESEGEKVEDMLAEMERRDPGHQRTWVILVDGKSSQLAAIKRGCERLGVQVTLVVDLLHVIHYVWQAGKELFSEDKQKLHGWVEERVERLLKGEVSEVARGIRQSATKRGLQGESRKKVDTAVDYFLERKEYMNYDEYLENGLPIATGVIEGACRHLVNDRMALTEARWGLETGEAVLRLRALKLHGALDQYMEYHFKKEQKRLYEDAEEGIAA